MPASSPAVVSSAAARLRREWSEAPEPRRRRAAWLVAHPEAALVPITVVVVLAAADALGVGDLTKFQLAARPMIGPGFLDVLADPWLQIGTLYLALLGLVTRGLELLVSQGMSGALVSVLQAVLLVVLASRCAGRAAAARGGSAMAARWVVGTTLALGPGCFVDEAVQWGHLEEMLLVVLLVESGLLVRRGRPGWAGAVLGLAAGLKQWAVIGVGVLIARRWSDTRRAVVVAGLVTVAMYAPFLVWGEVNTLHIQWHWDEASLLARLGHATGLSDWGVRAVQGAAAGAVGVVLGMRWNDAPALLVLGVVTVRLVLDPEHLPYYLGAYALALVLWAWSAPLALRTRLALTTGAVLVGILEGAVAQEWFWVAFTVSSPIVLVGALRLDHGGNDGGKRLRSSAAQTPSRTLDAVPHPRRSSPDVKATPWRPPTT